MTINTEVIILAQSHPWFQEIGTVQMVDNSRVFVARHRWSNQGDWFRPSKRKGLQWALSLTVFILLSRLTCAAHSPFRAQGRITMPPDSVAGAIAFAIDQLADIDVGEIVVRPTAQKS